MSKVTERARIVSGNDLYYLEVRTSGLWLLIDCAEKPQMLENKLAFLNEAFRQAVAEERERCATVASELLPEKYEFGSYQYGVFRAASHEIANAIRQRDASKQLKKWQAKRRLTLDEWFRVIGNAEDEWFRVIGNAEETKG